MRFSPLCLGLATLLALPAKAANSQVLFTGLGDLAGGDESSSATGVSDDGSTVSGISSSTAGTEGFKWNEATGMSTLIDLAGANDSAGAQGVSSNGSYACGFGTIGTGIIRAARWTGSAAPIQLGTINIAGYRYSQASGISGDGSKIVGVSSSDNGLRAFIWTETAPDVGDMTNLNFLLPSPSQSGDFGYSSEANSISADGNTVVGSSSYTVSETVTIPGRTEVLPILDDQGNVIDTETIYFPPYDQTTVLEQGTEAFVWTSVGGMVGLGDLLGGNLFSQAYASSADGSIIVGGGQHNTGEEGIVWTDGVIEAIGDFDGGFVQSLLRDVTADGTIAVGYGTDALGEAALIWSSEFGIGNLNTLLEQQGVNLGGWRLTSATGISADGQVIVGNGINPSGNPEAWRISDGLTLLNILVPPPDGLQESMSVFRGHAARFTAERGRSYQLIESVDMANWTAEGDPISTANAGDDFVHALPINKGTGSYFYLLGPSTISSEADTPINLIEGTLLQYTSERGFIYEPEYSDDLITWIPFDSPLNTSSDSGPVDRVFIDTSAPNDHAKRFYRINTVQSDALTVPFDLHIGPSITMTMPIGELFQLQTRPKGTSDPFTDYGDPFSTEGAAEAHQHYSPISLPLPTVKLITLPGGADYFNQNVLSLADGAIISFTSQVGVTYQVQKSTDDITFVNVGDAIDTSSDSGTALRMVLDPIDSSNPPANLSYRVVETPAGP